ncbi:MAG: hypothetical protein ACE5IJ_08015, partial [Thermoplasmata archaeon]
MSLHQVHYEKRGSRSTVQQPPHTQHSFTGPVVHPWATHGESGDNLSYVQRGSKESAILTRMPRKKFKGLSHKPPELGGPHPDDFESSHHSEDVGEEVVT